MASEGLRRLLGRNALVQDQLWSRAEARAQAQGGPVLFHLVALGVDPDAILRAQWAAGLPVATDAALRMVPPDALERVEAALARAHAAVPVRFAEGALQVAMADPLDPEGLAALALATGLRIVPMAVDAVHLSRALERHYDLRLPGLPGAPGDLPAPRPSPGPLPAPPPPAEELEALFRTDEPERVVDLVRRKPGAETGLVSETAPLGGGKGLARVELTRPASPSAPGPERPAPVRVEPPPGPEQDVLLGAFASAVAGLREAASPDEAGAAALAYLVTAFPRAALFTVRSQQLQGWTAGGGFAAEHVRELSFPADVPTLLWRVATTEAPLLGPLPQADADDPLYGELRPVPGQVAVQQVRVGGRVAALLYGDAPAGRGPGIRLDLLLRLAAELGEALERLIRARK